MKFGKTHWSVPEDSVSWNPSYLIQRVGEILDRMHKPADFIGALDSHLVMVGTHYKNENSVGYTMQAYHFDRLNQSLYPVGKPIDWDGATISTKPPEFEPKEFLTVFLEDTTDNVYTRVYKQFAGYAWTVDTYFPTGVK